MNKIVRAAVERLTTHWGCGFEEAALAVHLAWGDPMMNRQIRHKDGGLIEDRIFITLTNQFPDSPPTPQDLSKII